MKRAERKIQHLQHALAIKRKHDNGLNDVQFVHHSIPELSIDDVSISTKIGELILSSPIVINAMTGGGGEKTEEINRRLARVAKECGIAMAVGSQMAAIKDEQEIKSYQIVRDENPDGLVLANLGSEATLEQVKRAIDMVQANALQIHLNIIQELTMPEGDRNFSGTLSRLEKIATNLELPIIVKEVGFGISRETVRKLIDAGISIIDVGGFGGTNFAEIENRRRKESLPFFNQWGISTAASIVEVRSVSPSLSVISSGGLKDAADIAKSIALGASAAAFAGRFLEVLMTDGEEALINEINIIKEHIRLMMIALGVRTINELQKVPIIISGKTHHWLQERSIDTKVYSNRHS
ncbi:type 2 isopentenyl-diphosphate Delta-isomerase [Schinkia sp. CFF1]